MMIFAIHDILKTESLADIVELAERGKFVDGKHTAGWHARLVKNNQQLSDTDEILQQATDKVLGVLSQHQLFQLCAHPRKILQPLFSRYTQGMSYGSHVDNALMGPNHSFRSDISMTIFLSDPGSYDGGELVMETASGDKAFKLPAGSALLYPSTTLHRVEPVTSGTRLVVVTWIQSQVRSAEQRQVLVDIDAVRRALFEKNGKTREFDLLCKSFDNLLRMWAEP